MNPETDLTLERRFAAPPDKVWRALTEPDLITGTRTDESEQLVVGANNPLLLASEANCVQHPDPARSFIMLKRVESDWDCERLAAEEYGSYRTMVNKLHQALAVADAGDQAATADGGD